MPVKPVLPNLLSYGYWGSFPGGKAQGREVNHSPPASAEVTKTRIYTTTLLYVFMA
jgi:hypothetical protein